MSESESRITERPYLPHVHLGKVGHLPEVVLSGIDERRSVLAEFAEDPENPDIWDYVQSKALEEEAEGTAQPEKLWDIPVTELTEFGAKVRGASPNDRYKLTTEVSPSGEIWFDILHGFHGPSGNEIIGRALDYYLGKETKDRVDLAVDLGTGTGETADAIAPYAKKVVGLDKNTDLLNIARNRHPDFHFVRGDVTKLPFENNSVDVITSGGIKYSLNGESSIKMYEEIARVLKDGGVYIDSDWTPARDIVIRVQAWGGVEKPDFHPEELATFVTWRSVLQDMIVDTVSGKAETRDQLAMTGHKWQGFLTELGLVEVFFRVRGGLDFSPKLGIARMLYKDAERVEAERKRRSAYTGSL